MAVIAAVQGGVTAAVEERTTASSKEQKYRLPVIVGSTGAATML